MKVRVTNGDGWYADKVGEEFDVVRVQTNRRNKKEYVVHENEAGYTWIDEDDCEEVERLSAIEDKTKEE